LQACLAWFLLTFTGAFTAIVIRAEFNCKNKLTLPYRWSWPLFIRDNLNNLLLVYFISFILFRSLNPIILTKPNTGFAILTGTISNELALFLLTFSFNRKK
jgi:hypothetical protein